MQRSVRTSVLSLTFVSLAAMASGMDMGSDMKGMAMPMNHSATVPRATKGPLAAKSYYVRVPTKEVCMVNNAYMGKAQIPVVVGGKTYYGCCEGCKKTLAEKPESRIATDPLSGKEVDKALAFIGKEPTEGKIAYFESMANLRKYRP